ncbi:MAG: rhamnulokinase [Planctomycetes bacterium]|nr:rhamnulokinase [Planctomycetota bacterium]
MPERCFLGVDIGAESGRVMAGLFDGRRVRLEELRRFPNGPVVIGGTMRWNVLGLWDGIRDGLAQAAGRFGAQVASVGVDTWGVDYVLMSARDELLGLPWHYRDGRTRGRMADAFHRVPRQEIFAATGLQFMEINTLYQLLAAHERDPELFAAADRLLLMPDFFHWCLCGSRVVEFTNATTTQCYSATQREWAYELLKKLQLPTHVFPQVVEPGTKLGPLREDVAKSTGLARIDVTAPATHDTAAAVAAVPTLSTGRPDWAYISSGTWSLMGLEVPRAVVTPQALARNVTNEGGLDGTWRLLKNIMGLWLVQECRRSFERRGGAIDYAELTQRASAAVPFRSLVDPDDPSFLNPEDMPAAISEWCRASGQPAPEDEGQFVRCALESLALKYRRVLGWLEELSSTRVETIHIVGGGTQNELLNQFAANACGRPVVAGPVEATVLGNVLVQARTAGELATLAEIREVVRNSSELARYEPADAAAWDEAWERFERLCGGK